MDERDFYNPVKKYFEGKIANALSSKIEVTKTHDPTPKDIGLAHPGIRRILRFYSYEPDLIGIVYTQKRKTKKGNKLIIIKIKTSPIKLADFYELKIFSEIIRSDFSFLVSPYSPTKKTRRLISKKFKNIKNYYFKTDGEIFLKKIIVGRIKYKKEKSRIKIREIEFDTELSSLC